MIILLILYIFAELNETGYLYSVGKKKFLSLDGDDVRLVPKYIMPSMFEIETRPGDSSYTLRIYPSPRQNDKVVDKDWYWNDHKLIIHPTNNWQSEHFIFSLVPKNMLKIVVKEKCAEVTDDGYVKAKDCLSRKDGPNQYFRWFNKNDKFIVEQFVEKHGGKPNKKYEEDSEYNSEEYNRPRKKKRYENYGGRPDNKREDDSSSDFFKRPRGRDRRRDNDRRKSTDKNREEDEDSFDRSPPGYPPYNKYPPGYPPYNKYPQDERSGGKNFIYKYNGRPSHFTKDIISNPKGNDESDEDICTEMSCDPYNKRGRKPYDKPHIRGKNNAERLDCDELVDGIENLICDIEKMPTFIA
ncbi:hypothetical protein P3W45_001767 [Vairimorpha bombi]|jgi:hypothetical protein